MEHHFQAICQCAILLVTIFTAIGAQQIQGRPLTPTTKQELKPHFSAGSSQLPHPGPGFGGLDVEKKDNFRPTTPGNSPGVGHHLVEGSGTAAGGRPVYYVKGLKDDFRPTTPGNSPGVGHHLIEGSGTAEGGRSVHYVKGLKDDFRPTTPGHSPGIGHTLHRAASEPKA